MNVCRCVSVGIACACSASVRTDCVAAVHAEARQIITRARPTSSLSAQDALYPVKMTHGEAKEIGQSMERTIAKRKV